MTDQQGLTYIDSVFDTGWLSKRTCQEQRVIGTDSESELGKPSYQNDLIMITIIHTLYLILQPTQEPTIRPPASHHENYLS